MPEPARDTACEEAVMTFVEKPTFLDRAKAAAERAKAAAQQGMQQGQGGQGQGQGNSNSESLQKMLSQIQEAERGAGNNGNNPSECPPGST